MYLTGNAWQLEHSSMHCISIWLHEILHTFVSWNGHMLISMTVTLVFLLLYSKQKQTHIYLVYIYALSPWRAYLHVLYYLNTCCQYTPNFGLKFESTYFEFSRPCKLLITSNLLWDFGNRLHPTTKSGTEKHTLKATCFYVSSIPNNHKESINYHS